MSQLLSFFVSHFYADPLHFFSLLFLVCAIIHIFLTPLFSQAAVAAKAKFSEEIPPQQHFIITLLHYFGEVEIVFILWAIPLFITIAQLRGWDIATAYFSERQYTEAIFVFIIMILSSTKPIVQSVKRLLQQLSQLFGNTIKAWWIVILTIAPLMGSLITEAGAMTLASLLLSQQFYRFQPSKKLAYATLGLLFVNVSVGGVLTHFAAPPVLMISEAWKWHTPFMFFHFGWKAIIGIALSNFFYLLLFKKEFAKLEKNKCRMNADYDEKVPLPPLWIIAIHILFLTWMVLMADRPVLTLGGFFLFLGFHEATSAYQERIHLRSPLMVAMFLIGIVIHADLQHWWIAPIFTQCTNSLFLMTLLTALTTVNDNAALTYLSSQVSQLSAQFKYAIVSGAVTGGGLTVMANAPNPIGEFLLKPHFAKKKINPLGLAAGALLPTFIMWTIFNFV